MSNTDIRVVPGPANYFSHPGSLARLNDFFTPEQLSRAVWIYGERAIEAAMDLPANGDVNAPVAVIAHPARYKFTATEEYALFSEFKAHGGQGVEVVTGSHTAAEYVTYADMAREFGLAASRGSDFHSPGESYTDLGKLPFLANTLTPVWELLADKVRVG